MQLSIPQQPTLRPRPVPKAFVSQAASLTSSNSRDGSTNGSQHLLLVEQPIPLVGHDVRRVMGRDGERVNVVARNREPEVIADERTCARIVMGGAGHLTKATEGLQVRGRAIGIDEQGWLLRIPGVIGDPDIRAYRHGPGAVIMVGLQAGVDAEAFPADVLPDDALVTRTGGAPVIEGDSHATIRTRSNAWLELVGSVARRVVVDRDRCRPRGAAIDRLRELDIELGAVPIIVRQVEVAGVGR